MTHMTIAQRQQLLANGQPEQRGKDHIPVVKLLIPGSGFTWLLTEIEPEIPSIAFGLCDLCMGFPELGYVDLEEMSQVKNRFGLGVECDLNFKANFPISVYARAARHNQCIIENEGLLRRYIPELFQPKSKL